MWLFDEVAEVAAVPAAAVVAAAASVRAAASADAVATLIMSSTVRSGMVEGGKENRLSDVGDGEGLRRAWSCAWCLVSGTLRLGDLARVAGGSLLICSCGGSDISWSVLLDKNLGKYLSMGREWAPRASTGVLVLDFP